MPVHPLRTGSPAPLDDSLAAMTGKWTIAILSRLSDGTKRFSQLEREIGSISHKTLTTNLRAMERDGFLDRVSYVTIPPRVEYTLTPLGNEVLHAFEMINSFAARHCRSVFEAAAAL